MVTLPLYGSHTYFLLFILNFHFTNSGDVLLEIVLKDKLRCPQNFDT
jgi:hypothetical protein